MFCIKCAVFFFIALVRVCCKLAKAFFNLIPYTWPELLSVQLSKEPLVISKYQQVSRYSVSKHCPVSQNLLLENHVFLCSLADTFLNCSLTACLEAAQLQMTDKTVKQSGIFLSQKLPKERVKIPKTVQKHRKCRIMLYI